MESPRAIDFWEGRMYILDPGANQIWRYDPSGGAYPGMPLEYFTGERRPDISRALDFAITNEGDIYLLLQEGWSSNSRARIFSRSPSSASRRDSR
ncbi:MAG: hypothetical protein IPK17_38160 [Chloroflexi bacterium]|uniref:hypothetical protein n=1 Tax=Candidatus Flexifilum breve TaxID=3140694 RepID=UPI003135F6C8|nr:hypothetical protein [Chloroflexota bacterium]